MASNNISIESSPQLDELITSLTEGERATYNQIIRSIKLSRDNFEGVDSWSDKCYTRNCIAQNKKFELILICWEKGQKTPIHDHGGEECWVKVIEGELKETIYRKNKEEKLEEISSCQSVKGQVTYMIDFMGYHQLENMSDKRSLTLHLYAKPIRTCNVYCEEEKAFQSKEMSYDTISELTKI